MKKITIELPEGCEVQIIKKEKEKKEPIIRTYQDLINNKITISGYDIITGDSSIEVVDCILAMNTTMNVAASEKVIQSMLAMAMISQLMPYYGGEITDEEWKDVHLSKFVIDRTKNKITPTVNSCTYSFLAFHTDKQRDEFLKYNEQLVKDYLMID